MGKEYALIPMSEITDAARDIAVSWVENFRPIGGIELEQKHKLASDIMNYASEYADKLINTPHVEHFWESVKVEIAHQFERWGDESGVPPHHFCMVLQYLLGKLTKAVFDFNAEKFIHHTITLAAVAGVMHKYFNQESQVKEWFTRTNK